MVVARNVQNLPALPQAIAALPGAAPQSGDHPKIFCYKTNGKSCNNSLFSPQVEYLPEGKPLLPFSTLDIILLSDFVLDERRG
jgi:hypothetical protein